MLGLRGKEGVVPYPGASSHGEFRVIIIVSETL